MEEGQQKNSQEPEQKKQEDAAHHHSSQKDQHDDEISIDFSKIKGWFSAKEQDNKAAQHVEKKHSAHSKVEKAESREDDEISIDFGKLKKIFSGGEDTQEKKQEAESHHAKDAKKEKSHKVSHDAQGNEDDEISIDLSGISGKLKGMFKADEHGKKGDEDITINWHKAGAFFKKYGIFFLVLIPIILSIHVRMGAAGLPITDQWAQDSVFNGIRSQIAGQIASQYPNLPQQNRDALVGAEFQKQIQQNWPQIEGTIKLYSNEYKKYFQDDAGIPYMPDIDTYYWMRYAENVLDHGYAGDEMREFGQYDTFQLAPEGRYVFPDTFPSYFLAYFHGFLTLFNSKLTLVQTMSYYPVLVAALSTLLVFLIALKVSSGIGALFAASMFAINTAFLGRSLYGHADNDGWVLFFPLLITWLFFEVFERDKLWKVIALGSVAGCILTVFTFAWAGGWWFIFDLIMGMAGISFLYLLARNFRELRQQKLGFFRSKEIMHLLAGVFSFVIVSAISMSIFNSFQSFLSVAFGPLSFSTIKDPVTAGIWPNVLTTVAELNTGSFNQAIQSVGGKFLFYIGVVGILLALFKRDAQGKRDVRYSILLALWFIATCYATIKGIRFTLLLAPAYAVAFGTAVGMLYALFSKWLSKELHVHKAITASLLVLLFSLLMIGPVKTAYGVAKNDLPIVNDTWWHALSAIREKAAPDAIITSWWDFGHHFKEIAKRRVTFDGTTQTFPPAHWVGKMLMTSDESLSVGILRMLDCSGGGSAFDLIIKETKNHARSIRILDTVFTQDKSTAQKTLIKEGMSKNLSSRIIGLTHCSPPEGYLISSNDMIGKSGVWSHFGSWNFEKADIWYNVRKKDREQGVSYIMEKFNYTKERAESVYYEVNAIPTEEEGNRWIAPWPGYSGTAGCARKSSDSEMFACPVSIGGNALNFELNSTAMEVKAVVNGNILIPKRIAYATKESVVVKEINGSTIDLGFTFIPESRDSFSMVVSSPELVGGLFTVTFYMNGHGLRYFEPFFSERGLIGTEVKVYKARWDGGKPHIEQKYVDALSQMENATMPVAKAVAANEALMELLVAVNDSSANSTESAS